MTDKLVVFIYCNSIGVLLLRLIIIAELVRLMNLVDHDTDGVDSEMMFFTILARLMKDDSST